MVLRAAEENVDLPSTGAGRDKGHGGMTLADFCAMPVAKEAGLSEAEVAGLRLYTGALAHPIPAVALSRQREYMPSQALSSSR